MRQILAAFIGIGTYIIIGIEYGWKPLVIVFLLQLSHDMERHWGER